jgi:hypothetical protein
MEIYFNILLKLKVEYSRNLSLKRKAFFLWRWQRLAAEAKDDGWKLAVVGGGQQQILKLVAVGNCDRRWAFNNNRPKNLDQQLMQENIGVHDQVKKAIEGSNATYKAHSNLALLSSIAFLTWL